jgi:iron-sulfur cluster assembly protein
MIHLSPAATTEVLRLRSRTPNSNAMLRIGVIPGGCLEWSYLLSLTTAATPQDQVYQADGLEIAIAIEATAYINGLTLDYSEDLMGGGFRFTNPNATQSCNCGNSFSLVN